MEQSQRTETSRANNEGDKTGISVIQAWRGCAHEAFVWNFGHTQSRVLLVHVLTQRERQGEKWIYMDLHI